ncbi:amidophosphoribosyltransferase [Holotrichia oblita]|nr:amidophosphoribosyltransferase [Holotrichia oblita]
MFDSVHEECGVFGIFDHDGRRNVAKDIYLALYALQHRGQQSAGIAVNYNGAINHHKDLGLANEVFNEMILNGLGGYFGCGHVRYSKEKSVTRDEAQPFLAKHIKGQIAIAHNGNIINAQSLRDELSERGAMFQSASDAEVLAHIIARERLKTESTEASILNVMKDIKGAFSLVIVTMNKLIAVRDENGFRPLCIGKLGNCTIVSSESCAIDALGGTFVRDIEPGEVVVVDINGMKSYKDNCVKKGSLCIFEHVYFARPDSIIDNVSVHFARKAAGAELAMTKPVEADIVVGVPDSGIDAALGYAEKSGIPYGIGLTKNRYIGRTFIQTSAAERLQAVKIKLNALKSVVNGKRIILIDDSIVRGTTTASLVSLMRDAGATEVHVRISSPPFLYPCYFGTDIDSQDKLIAHRLTEEEIRISIDADTLAYLPLEGVKKMMKDSKTGYCVGCFTRKYPVKIEE